MRRARGAVQPRRFTLKRRADWRAASWAGDPLRHAGLWFQAADARMPGVSKRNAGACYRALLWSVELALARARCPPSQFSLASGRLGRQCHTTKGGQGWSSVLPWVRLTSWPPLPQCVGNQVASLNCKMLPFGRHNSIRASFPNRAFKQIRDQFVPQIILRHGYSPKPVNAADFGRLSHLAARWPLTAGRSRLRPPGQAIA